MPLHDSCAVGNIVGLFRRLTVHDALTGAFSGALLTFQAKIPYTELNGLIRNQRQIRQNFSQPHSGSVLGRYQQPVAGDFAQSGVNGDGDAAGGIIAAGNGLIT